MEIAMSATRRAGTRLSLGRFGRLGLGRLGRNGLRMGNAARRRPTMAVVAVLAGLAVVLGCGWVWFRDSSLVSVKRVQITGVSGPGAARIRAALRSSILDMTTLDVDMARLRASVQAYPDVRTLSVGTHFPHAVVIHVFEQIPVAALTAAGRSVAVSGSGALLGRPVASDGRLPQIALGYVPSSPRLRAAGPRAIVAVLAAAPWRMLGHVEGASRNAADGVVVKLRSGPEILFGPANDLPAKWAAALAVLGSSGASGAQYIDVSDPGHPAAGARTPSGTTTAPNATGAPGTSTTPGVTTGATGATGTAGAAAPGTAGTGGTGTPATGTAGAGGITGATGTAGAG
jgi:cell division protein FtsQ